MQLSVAGSGTAKVALDTANTVGSVVGAQRADEKEEEEDSGTDDHKAALGRLVITVFSPSAASTRGVLAHLVATKLVPDQTSESNGVTKELLVGDRVVEEHDGGSNQEDILEDTAEGHDERRGLANLHGGLARHIMM